MDGSILGPLVGSDMYATTWPEGRKCVEGRHHHSNSSFVRFLQSGCMEYHCFGSPCCKEPALETGDWVMSLAGLLNSSVWSEGTVVNEALLKHLPNLVEQISEDKSGAACQEWFRLKHPTVEAPGADSHPLPEQIRCPYQGRRPVCGQAAAAQQHHC